MTDFKRLDELTEQGYLRRVISPCGRLVLYNYTDACTFAKNWTRECLNSRGTVYELATGKMVARAFPKFFNFEELPASKSRNLAKKTGFQTFEKVDGSLGIIYFYDNKWRINTRGSFTSDQATYALNNLLPKYDLSNLSKDISLMAEIIYPENKIIVNYGDEQKLVLLSAFRGEPFFEYDYEDLEDISKTTGIELIKRYRYETIEELIEVQSKLPAQEEGFVVRFDDGYRVKFKSKEYLKIAAMLAHMTPLHFWKLMKDGKMPIDELCRFPEEFRAEADEIAMNLELSYEKTKSEVLSDGYSLINLARSLGTHEELKKNMGLNMKSFKYGNIAFALLDNDFSKINEYIMKIIRPTGNKITIE